MSRRDAEHDSGDHQRQLTATGRTAQFYCPVDSEEDVQAVAQRVAQFVMAGYGLGELDGVQIRMREVEYDD